jgi:hypothetical protein
MPPLRRVALMPRFPWEKRKLLYEAMGFDPGLGGPGQVGAVSDDGQFIVLAGGIGSGKSYTSSKVMFPELAWPNHNYWIVAEGYINTRQEFLYLVEDVEAQGFRFINGPNMPKEGSWDFAIEGSTKVTTKSVSNPESLHAEEVDGMLVCEAGLFGDGWTWDNRLLPRLVRANGWVFCNGTFEASGLWMKHIFNLGQRENVQGWKSYGMATWDNNEVFMERYGAVPRKPSLLVFKEFEPEHIGELSFDEDAPVYLGVDPGSVNPYAVVVVQIVEGDRIQIIDEIYVRGMLTEEIIIGNDKLTGFVPVIDREWFPNIEGVAIDATAPDEARRWGQILNVGVMRQKVDIEAGITRFKEFLRPGLGGEPNFMVDLRCVNFINEMGLYRRKRPSSDLYEPDERPVDAYNHAIKAAIYFICNKFGTVERFEPYSVLAHPRGDRFAHLR